MSLYRPVSTETWTDSKVVDDYTADDLYFWLYLLTNPRTNLLGCYELSISQSAYQMKWTKEKVWEYLKRFCEVHMTIGYNEDTKEIIIFNWAKYNWTKSPSLIASVRQQILSVKCEEYRKYLSDMVDGLDTVSIPYGYRGYTVASANASAITNPCLLIKDKTNTQTKERIQERKTPNFDETDEPDLSIDEFKKALSEDDKKKNLDEIMEKYRRNQEGDKQ